MRDDRRSRSVDYKEGDVFVVSDGMVGVVTRRGTGVICCHLFQVSAAEVDEISLEPASSTAVVRVDDDLLLNGTWRVIRKVVPWSRTTWPMPPFGVYWDEIPIASLTTYSDDDVAIVAAIRETELETAREFPIDQLFSSRHLESTLVSMADGPAYTVDARTNREVRAYFTVPSKSSTALLGLLEKEGWDSRLISRQESHLPSDAGECEVVGTMFLDGIPDYSEVQRTRESAESLAARVGGSLTAWETEVG